MAPGGRRRKVRFASGFRRAPSAHFLAPPFPSKPTSLGFAGDPISRYAAEPHLQQERRNTLPIITLYHPTADGVRRRELTVPYARWVHSADPSGGYLREDGGVSQVLIPWQEDLELAPGDGIYPGQGPEPDGRPLKALSRSMEIIQTLTVHRQGSPLDHWEVTSR